MMGADLGRRVAVAAIGIPAALAVLYLGGWVLTVALALLAGAGAWEVDRMARVRGWRTFPLPGLVAASALVLLAGIYPQAESWAFPALLLILFLGMGSLAAAVFLRGSAGDPLPAVAITTFGAIYVGLPFSFAVFLRAYPGVSAGEAGWAGALLLALPIAATWVGDSAAYFTGKHLGRRKLLPSVSPKKTVAGGVGGLLGSIVLCIAFAAVFLGPEGPAFLPLLPAALLGAVLGVAAPVGDLAESLLKREAGVKDSGALLPGHGGVLDRFDALLFTLPLTYLLLPFLLI